MATEKWAPNKKLQGRALLFAHEYVKDFNSRAAAERAGYAAGKNAQTRATELLHSPEIQAEIRRLIDKAADEAGVSAARLITEYAKVAFGDIGDCFDDDGRLLPVKSMSPEARAAIAGVDVETSTTSAEDGPVTAITTKKLRRWDKIKALDSLARIHGMFQDHVVVHGEDFANQLVKARERARTRSRA